jgi:hypothetical protein
MVCLASGFGGSPIRTVAFFCVGAAAAGGGGLPVGGAAPGGGCGAGGADIRKARTGDKKFTKSLKTIYHSLFIEQG